MKLTSPKDVAALLAELNFRPSKLLGQNFLIDANILRIMLDTAEIGPTDEVLEVGPGLGVMTDGLLAHAKRLVAIEKDKRLFAYLKKTFADRANLELIPGDALDADLQSLVRSGIRKVVSNLPYSVGSRILVELFECDPAPECIVVTVQHEVAERLAARPGSQDYGLLSVFAQLGYDVVTRKTISPTCFYPVPGVKSSIVSLHKKAPAVPLRDRAAWKAMVKEAFSHRRKQIGTIIPNADFARAGIEPMSRPEELSVEDWCRLANALPPDPRPSTLS